jgi:DNA polymerase-3 subunit gamma/tau
MSNNSRWNLKYRPSRFSDVVGQEHVVKFFMSVLQRHRDDGHELPLGVLFGGHSGVGKTTLARIIAAALNCNMGLDTVDPCGVCDICAPIIEGQGSVIEIDASFFGLVDNIRNLRDRLSSYSFAKYQVVIIDECHMLSREASNVLLKMFEEPPENVMFILCTTEVNQILETVRSRLIEFRFTKIAVASIVNYVQSILEQEGFKCDSDIIRKLYHLSRTNLRDVIVALEQLSLLSEGEITEDSVSEVFGDIFIHDKIIDGLLVGNYLQVMEVYEAHADYDADFKFLLEGLVNRIGERFKIALDSGDADARWYSFALREIYKFMGNRLVQINSMASARLLFYTLAESSPGEAIGKKILGRSVPKTVSGADILDVLTDS